jgi:hypothetical protein
MHPTSLSRRTSSTVRYDVYSLNRRKLHCLMLRHALHCGAPNNVHHVCAFVLQNPPKHAFLQTQN